MSNPTELPDLHKLEALARAATPDEWTRGPFGAIYCAAGYAVASASVNGTSCRNDSADEEFIAAANPAAVLALIAFARLNERMFFAACRSLGLINEALGLGPDGGGVDSILAAIEELKAARHAQPEGEAPQADAMAAFKKWHEEVGDQDCEYTWLQAWTAAQLWKPASAPGTPEAPKASIGDLTEFHVLLNWYDNEASYGSLNEGRNKLTEYIDKWASKRAAQLDGGPGVPLAATFKLGDRVRKTKGSQWRGRVVGTYSTALTPEGYAVESSTERGSVQIYPAAALEIAESPAQLDGGQQGSESNG